MQTTQLFCVDLSRIDGKGEFKCPKCGVEISPEDRSEEIYTILETTMKGDALEKIRLQCNNVKARSI